MSPTSHRFASRGSGALVVVLLVLGLFGASGCQETRQKAGPETDPNEIVYVALGDSYTAAPGVPTTSEEEGCLRSDHNYPALFAREHPRMKLIDRSCSGATTEGLLYPQYIFGQRIEPQLDALNFDTDLVTMSIGANDNQMFATWSSFCTRFKSKSGAPCRNFEGPEGGLVMLSQLGAVTQRVTGLVAEIHRRAPSAQVVLVGYPQIVPSTGTCPERLPLAEGDYAYALEINRGFNDAVAQAALATNSAYVDVWALSQGHDVCSADPWVAGKDDELTALRFHPFPAEQLAVAERLDEVVRQQGLLPESKEQTPSSRDASPSPPT